METLYKLKKTEKELEIKADKLSKLQSLFNEN